MAQAFAVLKKILTALWFWLSVATLLLSGLVWFGGPLIALGEHRPLAGATARLAVVLAIVTCWGLANLLIRIRQIHANQKLIAELQARDAEKEAAEEAVRSAADEELGTIRERAQDVLATLRTARFGSGWRRRYVYELPWYLLVGPPASGKTTALLNSGLSFPLAERFGKRWVTGLGGTRNCDWMITDDAVLIDTAGRYTDQRAGTEVDRSVWTGFLQLLKHHRPRQPINGALVLISPVELARMSETERRAQAAAIRERLLELRRSLGVRFPIYVLFSKMDLVLGFEEFFDSLGREERAQVWGMTFPLDDGKGDESPAAGYRDSFDGLVARLEQRLVKRLQEEPDHRRRSRILDFPAQLAALRTVTAEFLEQVFQTTRFESTLLLRGIYFTSGTQNGTPSDLLASLVAPTFAIGTDRLSLPLEPPISIPRACFLQRLFPDVIFAEARLVGLDSRIETARRIALQGLAAAAVALTAGLSLLWYESFTSNRDALDSAVTRADLIDRQEIDLRRDQGSPEKRFISTAAILDQLRALPGGYGALQREAPIPVTYGLYNAVPLSDASESAYRRGLRHLLLPLLLARLEREMQPRAGSPLLQFQTLKIYLMLGRRGPIDGDLVAAWADRDLRKAVPHDPAARARLLVHTKALIDSLPDHVPLDAEAIASARSRFSGTTLAMRGYDILRHLSVAKALPPWRPIDHAGAAATTVLVRPSGRTLFDGIEGLYTRQGFFDVVLPSIDRIAEAQARDGWVLGLPDDRQSIAGRVQRVRSDILDLYFDDYAHAWDDILADVVVAPFRSTAQAAAALNKLSSPSSPLKMFLSSAAEQTDLDKPLHESPKADASAAAPIAKQAAAQASKVTGAVSQFAQAVGAAAEPPPGHPLTVRFRGLHEAVAGSDGAPAPLQQALNDTRQLYTVFNKLANALPENAPQLASSDEMRNAVAALRTQAGDLPPPIGDMVAAVASSGTAVAVGGAQAYMRQVWSGGPAATCSAVVNGRFPFEPNAAQDAPMGDFMALLAPNGILDRFFNTHLKPFVDTTEHPWRWRQADNVDLGLPDEVLAQFERAAVLRKALFPTEGGKLGVAFEVEPTKVDERIVSLTLDVDGQRLVYRNGPIARTAMRWPGPENAAGARLSFAPDRGETPTTAVFGGPFGFLRLLESGTVLPDAAPDKAVVRFDVGGRTATFRLHAATVDNLFGELPTFAAFRCPAW